MTINQDYNDTVATENPLYTQIKPDLIFLDDMWRGKDAWCSLDGLIVDIVKAFTYLPPSESELKEYDKLRDKSSYYLRLKSSFYINFFKDTIVDEFTGLLARFKAYELPPSLNANINNVDRRGSSLNVFLQSCDNYAIRDDIVFVLVDYPQIDTNRRLTELEALQLNLSPSFKIIPRVDLINAVLIDNEPVLVVFKEKIMQQTGKYESQIVEQYCEYRNNNGQVSFAKYRPDDKDNLSIVSSGILQKMNRIPIFPYSYSSNLAWFSSDFTMKGLAELSLSYYRVDTDLREILHLCKPTLNINVALDEYLKLSSQTDQIKMLRNFDNIATGPRNVIRGDARWLEVSGNVISPIMQKMEEIETRIKEKTLAFKTGISKVAKTATEVNLDAAKNESWLIVLGEKKESLFTSLMQYWQQWTGEKYNPRIEIAKSIAKPKYQFNTSELLEMLSYGAITDMEFRDIIANDMYIPSHFDPNNITTIPMNESGDLKNDEDSI